MIFHDLFHDLNLTFFLEIIFHLGYVFTIFLHQKNIIFHDFPWPTPKFHDFPGLKNEILKFHDFPGFLWPVQTLKLYNLLYSWMLRNRWLKLTYTRFDVLEASLGQVTKESKRTLSYFGHFILERQKRRKSEPFSLFTKETLTDTCTCILMLYLWSYRNVAKSQLLANFTSERDLITGWNSGRTQILEASFKGAQSKRASWFYKWACWGFS